MSFIIIKSKYPLYIPHDYDIVVDGEVWPLWWSDSGNGRARRTNFRGISYPISSTLACPWFFDDEFLSWWLD